MSGDGLAELAAAAAQLAAAERLTEACRARRDALVLAAARAGCTHAEIGEAAGLSVQGIGKVTTTAGLRRYAPRSGPPGPRPDSAAGRPEPP